MEGDNLVMVHAGLQDVLKGRSQILGRQIDAGVRKLREVSGKVHAEICTIPTVWRHSLDAERRVFNANGVVRRINRRLEYGIIGGNKEAREAGPDPAAWIIQYSLATGDRVGGRLGRQVEVFLGAGPEFRGRQFRRS